MLGGDYNTGASQFAGGGFMSSPAPAEGAGGGSGMKKAINANATLRALTVKHLFEGSLNSADDDCRVDGAELHNVTLVGKLVSCEEKATQLIYKLDDGTGTVEACTWNDDGESGQMAQQRSELQVGTYARVHGQLRQFDGRRRIQAFNLKPIMDFNEVTYHLMQCIFQHAYHTKGASATANNQAAPKAEAAAANGGGGAFSGQNNLTGVQAEVLQAFKSPQFSSKETGVSIDDVIGLLSGRFKAHQTRQALQALVDDGHLYTTIDEYHYRAADM